MREISIVEALKIIGVNIGANTSNEEDVTITSSVAGTDFTLLKQDRNEEGTYKIIRRAVHDGTLAFTYQLIAKALMPLLNGTSCDKRRHPMPDEIPMYTIGKIMLHEVHDYVKPERFTWPTMCEEVVIPVRVEYFSLK